MSIVVLKALNQVQVQEQWVPATVVKHTHHKAEGTLCSVAVLVYGMSRAHRSCAHTRQRTLLAELQQHTVVLCTREWCP